MDDRLLEYYERELTFVRESGAEFAASYPKIAGRLLLEPDKCDDPHTERLIEAFAYISGRIHKKIDDDFPRITESLLTISYPHYNCPIPSVTIVRFDPVASTVSEHGHRIEAGAVLLSREVRGINCRFRLTQAVDLWPVTLADAQLSNAGTRIRNAMQMICLELDTCKGLDFSRLSLNSLRFFINGPHQHVFHLYELLFNHVCRLELTFADHGGEEHTIALSPEHLVPVGFGPEEQLLPYSKRSFPGYLLLFEYFCFPEKFLFFDLTGLEPLKQYRAGSRLSVNIYINRVAKEDLVINRDTFQLYAAPAANLFHRIAEPIRVAHRKTDYRVIPDLRHQDSAEIFTVDQVRAKSSAQDRQTRYLPFYSIRHHLDDESSDTKAFWHIQRRFSGRQGDQGTEVYLSFSDLDMNPSTPATDILTIHLTCTNRDLPARLPFGDPRGDFTIEVPAPVEKIITMVKPTPTRRPFLEGAQQWRLISHLSLNYLSLVQGGEDALREMLTLYNFENSTATRQQIEGIVSVTSRHVTKRIRNAFCRGVEVTITFDEDKFVGAGLFLFASVLERFLAQYVSVNSFSQLVVKTLQQKEILKIWPPRSGNQVLL